MKNIGVGPGTHNRNTKKAIETQENSKNLTKECKCIIHRTELNKGTVISKTRFNRQSSSPDGVQYMCSTGKTLIDKVKHQLWRVISLLLLSSIKENLPVKETTEFKNFININFFSTYNVIEQLNEIFNDPIIKDFNSRITNVDFNMDASLYYKTSTFLENKLTLDNLYFYSFIADNEKIALERYNSLLMKLKKLTNIDKLNSLGEILDELTGNDFDSKDFFIQESADKNIFYPVDSVSKNWSKMNNLFEVVNGKYIKTEYRGPFHNTKATINGTTSRVIKYLVEIHKNEGFKETNAYIKLIKKPGFDADHIWPLALGGKHTTTNISSLLEEDNLSKKDHITYDSYILAIQDISVLNKMVSKEFVEEILNFLDIVGKDKSLFEQNVKDFENKLRRKMEERQNNFNNMITNDKVIYLNKIRPDLNDKNIVRFIERFERHKRRGEYVKY